MRVLDANVVTHVMEEQSHGHDLYADEMGQADEWRWGLGLLLNNKTFADVPHARAFGIKGVAGRGCGHAGAGGSFAWADPDARVSWSWVNNYARFERPGVGDFRATSIADALYGALGY